MRTIDLLNYTEKISRELGYEGKYYHEFSEWESNNYDGTHSQGFWYKHPISNSEISFYWNIEINHNETDYKIIDEGFITTDYGETILQSKEKIKRLLQDGITTKIIR